MGKTAAMCEKRNELRQFKKKNEGVGEYGGELLGVYWAVKGR